MTQVDDARRNDPNYPETIELFRQLDDLLEKMRIRCKTDNHEIMKMAEYYRAFKIQGIL